MLNPIETTLWGGSAGWTDGSRDYGGNCSARDHAPDEIEQVVKNYLAANSRTFAVYATRTSGANCPYIDLAAMQVDQDTARFLLVAADQHTDVGAKIAEANSAEAVAEVGARYGFKVDPAVIAKLNAFEPTTLASLDSLTASPDSSTRVLARGAGSRRSPFYNRKGLLGGIIGMVGYTIGLASLVL
jgi:hypothetical protein